jgi:hypothetical protein
MQNTIKRRFHDYIQDAISAELGLKGLTRQKQRGREEIVIGNRTIIKTNRR